MKFLELLKYLFGFKNNEKPVRNYLYDSNVKSGIFMSAVVVMLEIWLIIRQIVKYVAPGMGTAEDGFAWIFQNISVFLLFFFAGIAMFLFCFSYAYNNKITQQNRFIVNLIASGVLGLYSLISLFPLCYTTKMYIWNSVSNSFKSALLIVVFMSGLLLAGWIIYYTLFAYLKKKESRRLTVGVIASFALLCLAFGFRVSFSDHIRLLSSVSSTQNEIICFLTMVTFVSALLIYKPYISIGTNVLMFVLFYLAIYKGDAARAEEIGKFTGGDKVNYVTFLIALTTVSVMVYHQRLRSALAEYSLRYNAEFDELTGLSNTYSFYKKLNDFLVVSSQKRLNEKIVLFIDVFNFKVFNEQRGFNKGNDFLLALAKTIEDIFKGDLMCRDSGDQYVVLTDVNGFRMKINDLKKRVRDLDREIKPSIRVGGYILNNPNEDVRRIVDKARYACGTIADRLDIFYVEYDKQMHDNYHFNQYVIRNLDAALESGFIKPYYQPIVSGKDFKVCAMEALARWEDPNKGMLTPGQFIFTLEKTKLIHKLDAHIIECVFKDMKECLDNGLKIVPCSINVSRLDFQLMNVVGLLDMLVEKYNIPKDYFHVEVTESALTDDNGNLMDDLIILKNNGYHIWLDDFGSAYSSFSTLKDYDFEVLKLDMRFLSNFEKKEKNRIILSSIFRMSEQLNMDTVTEGVENEEEKEFLASNNCKMLQGYLFSKPLTKEDYFEKINNSELEFSDYIGK